MAHQQVAGAAVVVRASRNHWHAPEAAAARLHRELVSPLPRAAAAALAPPHVVQEGNAVAVPRELRAARGSGSRALIPDMNNME